MLMRALARVCILFGCCSMNAAFAHASLLAANPADGTIAATAPPSFTLEFNEPVTPVTLHLVAPDGRAFPLKYALEEKRIVMRAPAQLGDGTYALSWRVISADGHPVGGTTVFSIGAPSRIGEPVEREVANWPVDVGIWSLRVLTYLGLFIGVGGVFFCRWISREDAGVPLSRVAIILGLTALAVSGGFQGLDVLNQPVASIFSTAVWKTAVTSSFGLFLAFASIALVLALLASARLPAPRLLALAALLCAGLSLAATGHASTADPQWLMRPAVFLHTSIVSFWAGALMPLATLLRKSPASALAPLRRFSACIPPLLGLLLVSGIALAVVQLSSPEQLFASPYGRVLLAKLALVALLIGLAAINRWRLTEPVLEGLGEARRRLVRSIRVEIVLIGGILGVVALWRFTPPPRALLEAAAQPAHLHIHAGDIMSEVTVQPGHAGPVKVTIQLVDAAMNAIPAKGVTVEFSNKAKSIEPIERKATVSADGDWLIDDLHLPVAGTWRIEVDVLISDFREERLDGELSIRP